MSDFHSKSLLNDQIVLNRSFLTKIHLMYFYSFIRLVSVSQRVAKVQAAVAETARIARRKVPTIQGTIITVTAPT